MGAFIAAGGSSADYWNSTPREVAAVLAAARAGDKARWQAAQAQGWLTAALGRTDEFPTLEELLGDDEGEMPNRSGASAQLVEDHNWRLWQMVIDRQFGGDTVQ